TAFKMTPNTKLYNSRGVVPRGLCDINLFDMATKAWMTYIYLTQKLQHTHLYSISNCNVAETTQS
ncbi:MAG: hypothetical protein LBD15_04220, partial [Holosporales bacterium]|nr:hypothetical protein [Holosporales bacterium]